MNEHFESDAFDYLLNQMDSARRVAFEQQLENSVTARAALKRGADALAKFACDTAAAEPLSADDHRDVLGAIVAAARSRDPQLPESHRRIWRHVFWPAAAAILFTLNLVDFKRPIAPGETHRRSVSAGEKSARRDTAKSQTDPTANDLFPGTKKTQTPEQNSAGRADGTSSRDGAAELDRLQAIVAELQQAQERMRVEYDQLVRRLAEQAIAERDLNRLTTMELVDSGTYARGERKGLVGIGRGVLTEPGIVTPPNSAPLPGGTSVAVPVSPYAWSVFDEKEHRGYLNLYQLPALPAEQSMQVWIRPSDTKDYQHVAEVPQPFQGGNGSVQYFLPAATSAPAEVLITVEPRNVAPVVPTGPTVLRGP